jgi:hypothetical protein
MPSFEQNFRNKGNANKGSAYEKLLAICKTTTDTQDTSIVGRSGKISVALKDSESFYDNVDHMEDDLYSRSAGADISNILYPFRTKKNVLGEGGLPGFHPNAPSAKTNDSAASGDLQALLPFKWNTTDTTTLVDRYNAPSGDSLTGMLSSDARVFNIEQFRDITDIRTFGLRLPVMAVGWGYTLGERKAMPSGTASETASFPSGTRVFRGGVTEGWQVDPSNYIAAPIDFQYDVDRHVWTCGGGQALPPGKGRYKVLTIIDDQDPGKVAWDYPRFT